MPMGKIDLMDTVKHSLVQYSREFNTLELYLFPEVWLFSYYMIYICINAIVGSLISHKALEYISRVDRVLSHPQGSLLMAGTSGAGRRNVLNLVAFMHRMAVFSPKITRGYSAKVISIFYI